MISVNWATKVIYVPQSFLTPLGGGVYELDTDDFRLALKDLEDDEVGMPFLHTHNRNAPAAVGGVDLAPVILIVNGYVVEFENLQYAVKLTGSNNNIADVAVVNQVSIRPTNSAGLVMSPDSVIAPTQQQIRDAMKLAPSAGAPAVNSVEERLIAIEARVRLNVAYSPSSTILRIETYLERGAPVTSPTSVSVVWHNADSTVLFSLTQADALAGQNPDAGGNYVFVELQPLVDNVTYSVDVTITDAEGSVTRRDQVVTLAGA